MHRSPTLKGERGNTGLLGAPGEAGAIVSSFLDL